MKILTRILLGLTALLLILGVVIALQPATFQVERSTTIAASRDVLYAEINNLPRFQDWSPWAKLDLNTRYNYEGPAIGPGASYTWVGNNQVGEGRMTITGNPAPDRILMRVEFRKPFASTNDVKFELEPLGPEKTRVTWIMFGKQNFLTKAFGLFMSMDKMVGGDFEKGLANLKGLAESGALPAAATAPQP